MRWTPSEKLTTDLIFSYSVDKDGGGSPRPLGPYPAFNPGQSTIFFGGVNPTGATPNSEDPNEVRSDIRQFQKYETFWGQAIVEAEIPKHVIKLNANYQYWDFAINRDQDFTDNDAIELTLLDKHKTWSGEATIRSEYESRFNWLFGANYQDDSAPNTDVPLWHHQAAAELVNFAVFDVNTFGLTSNRGICGASPCAFTAGDRDWPYIRFKSDVDTKTAGVFLDGGVDLTEQLHVQAGVRYSWTERLMRDTGTLDILLEPFDVVTDGFCGLLGIPGAGTPGNVLYPKENCFNLAMLPGIFQPQVGATPLNAGNFAWLLPLNGQRKQKEWDSVTGRVRLEWRPADDQLFYAGYSRGERHGGFNFFQAAPFDSETINAYELGAKNSLLDGRLLLNTNFFYYDFENRFITEVVNNVTTTVNAPTSVIYGLELQWIWAPTDRLRISGNAGWLHAEITSDFLSQDDTVSETNPNGFCPTKVYPATPGSFFAGLPAVGDRHGRGPTCDGAVLQNLKGNVLPRSPKFSVSASAQYAFDLGAGTLTPRLDFAYRGAVYYRQYENPLDRQNAYTRTDLRVRYEFTDTPIWFEAYIQNLEDNQKIKTQLEAQLNWSRFYWLAAPRTVGIRMGFKFTGASAGDLWPF
jgi:outer membrane receptor protein involved in Fe transport